MYKLRLFTSYRLLRTNPFQFAQPLFPVRFVGTGRQPTEPPKSFLGQMIQNIKQEMEQSKEMKESLSKFRKEKEKLEKSDQLLKARAKYEAIERETVKSSQILKDKLDAVKGAVKETFEEAQKSEAISKATESLSKAGEAFSKATESVKTLSQATSVQAVADAIKKELAEAALRRDSTVYKKPEKLLMRDDLAMFTGKKDFEADTTSKGMVLHKESKWFQSWQNFKENNAYVNKLFEMKMKFDESDSVAVRLGRSVSDRFISMFGSVFQQSELSSVSTEICKIDPTFDPDEFLDFCRVVIIPNILEAIIQRDMDVLKDWCNESLANLLGQQIQQMSEAGRVLDMKILDLSSLDLAAGRMMEQGPVLIITFVTQEVEVLRDRTGKIVEGDPDKIFRTTYIWALCRNQEDLDPRTAWRLMELSCQRTEQLL